MARSHEESLETWEQQLSPTTASQYWQENQFLKKTLNLAYKIMTLNKNADIKAEINPQCILNKKKIVSMFRKIERGKQ